MRTFVTWLLLTLVCSAFVTKKDHSYTRDFPERKLLFGGTYGPPAYNQFNFPGQAVNPLAYQTPFYPRGGQSSMLPAPPAVFHDGALPIMNIYELHHPDVYTPNSPYGLPHIYNPYHGLNLPYNYLHHPFASQLLTQMSFNSLAADPYIGTPMTTANLINPGIKSGLMTENGVLDVNGVSSPSMRGGRL